MLYFRIVTIFSNLMAQHMVYCIWLLIGNSHYIWCDARGLRITHSLRLGNEIISAIVFGCVIKRLLRC